MTDRLAELIAAVERLKMPAVSCFAPQRADGSYPFAGGGFCTAAERQAVVAHYQRPSSNPPGDPAEAARNRAHRAAARRN